MLSLSFSLSLSFLPLYLFPRPGLPALEDLLLDPELLLFLEALLPRGLGLLAKAEESSSRERCSASSRRIR